MKHYWHLRIAPGPVPDAFPNGYNKVSIVAMEGNQVMKQTEAGCPQRIKQDTITVQTLWNEGWALPD